MNAIADMCFAGIAVKNAVNAGKLNGQIRSMLIKMPDVFRIKNSCKEVLDLLYDKLKLDDYEAVEVIEHLHRIRPKVRKWYE